jgi:hypothetical protein
MMHAHKTTSNRFDEAAAFQLGRLTNEYHFYLSQWLVFLGLDREIYEEECTTLKQKICRSVEEIGAEVANTHRLQNLRNTLTHIRNRLAHIDVEIPSITLIVTGKRNTAPHGIGRTMIGGLHHLISAMVLALGVSIEDAIYSELVPLTDDINYSIGDLLPDGWKEVQRFDDATRRAQFLNRVIGDFCSFSTHRDVSSVPDAWMMGLLIDQGIRWRQVTPFMFPINQSSRFNQGESVMAALRTGVAKQLTSAEYASETWSPHIVDEGDIIPSDQWYARTNAAIQKFNWQNRVSIQLSEIDPALQRDTSKSIRKANDREWKKAIDRIAKTIHREFRRPWKSENEARDKWIYEQLRKGKKPTPVLKEYQRMPALRDWEPINSVAGLTQAAKRYAKRHGLPLIKGPRGRKKTQKSKLKGDVKRKKRDK